jgi:hypothetical protein
MKQWKVVVWPSGKPRTETVVSATDYWAAKRVAAAMFQCNESDVTVQGEVK